MITSFDHFEPAPQPPAQFTLRRQDARAGDVVVRANAIPVARSRRRTVAGRVPVQFTETSFTPRIQHVA